MGLLNRIGGMVGRAMDRPLPANNPLIKRGMGMMEQRTSADEAHRAFAGGMFGARPDPQVEQLAVQIREMAGAEPGAVEALVRQVSQQDPDLGRRLMTHLMSQSSY